MMDEIQVTSAASRCYTVGHSNRGLISDKSLLARVEVLHLIGPGEQCEHCFNPARRTESLQPIYDQGVTSQLDLGEGVR